MVLFETWFYSALWSMDPKIFKSPIFEQIWITVSTIFQKNFRELHWLFAHKFKNWQKGNKFRALLLYSTNKRMEIDGWKLFFKQNMEVILHFSYFFGRAYFFINFFQNLCMYLKVDAYTWDGLLFRKLSFWVCLKTRRVTKRDVLALATLRYFRF